MMYGQGNSGPAREVWWDGDRVRFLRSRFTGTVRTPGVADPERNAMEIGYVFVRWDDGETTYADPRLMGGLQRQFELDWRGVEALLPR